MLTQSQIHYLMEVITKMANTIRIKRRASGGAAGAPASLENAELAYNEVDDVLYYGKGTGGAGGDGWYGCGGGACGGGTVASKAGNGGDGLVIITVIT